MKLRCPKCDGWRDTGNDWPPCIECGHVINDPLFYIEQARKKNAARDAYRIHTDFFNYTDANDKHF